MESHMTLLDRIKESIAHKGINMVTLEKELGFGNGTIRKWDKQNPSYDKILLVANYLNLNIEWLLTGQCNSDLTPEEQKLLELYRQADERGKRHIMKMAIEEAQELQRLQISRSGYSEKKIIS